MPDGQHEEMTKLPYLTTLCLCIASRWDSLLLWVLILYSLKVWIGLAHPVVTWTDGRWVGKIHRSLVGKLVLVAACCEAAAFSRVSRNIVFQKLILNSFQKDSCWKPSFAQADSPHCSFLQHFKFFSANQHLLHMWLQQYMAVQGTSWLTALCWQPWFTLYRNHSYS